jgi:hypothetical protein
MPRKCQETNEPEKLHYETQKDNVDGSRGDKERTARKSEKSLRGKRGRKARGTTRDDEQKPNAAFTTDEEMEIRQQREQIYKFKKKIESTYYQVTKIATDNRQKLQKL